MHTKGARMKTCERGGKWHRHCENTSANGFRYRCSKCRKTITVRDGKISTQRGRPMKTDWRHGVAA